jgi:hypothetical protein
MVRKLRPFLLVFALALTMTALGPKARAGECNDGDTGWVDFGTCCWPYNVVQLLRGECVDGSWQVVSSSPYHCLFDSPCG